MTPQPPSGEQPYSFAEPGSAADPGQPGEEWSNVPQVSSASTYKPKGTPPDRRPLYWGLGALALAFIVIPGGIYLLSVLRHSSQMSQLQGEWSVDAQGGLERGVGVLTIKDGKMLTGTRGANGGVEKESELGAFVIDATTEPKNVDVVLSAGPSKGQTSAGIYQVDGDRLTICLGVPGQPRPVKMERERGWMYLQLRRAK